MEDGQLEVVTPIENSPAARAGITANDVITKVDDKPVSGMTLDQAGEKLHGPRLNSSAAKVQGFNWPNNKKIRRLCTTALPGSTPADPTASRRSFRVPSHVNLKFAAYCPPCFVIEASPKAMI
jgi:PDZ domain